MRKREATFVILAILLMIAAALLNLRSMSLKSKHDQTHHKQPIESELDRIKREGVIRVAVVNNSIDYFTYKGRMMGLKYEMLQQLCNDLGVEMDLYIQDNIVSIVESLNRGVYDFAAQDITITKSRRALVDFTIPLINSEQVLVQRRPTSWYKHSAQELDTMMIHRQLQLGGKTVVVPNNSSFVPRLQALADEIGDTIYIVEDSIATVEGLIADVANEIIDYTVAYKNVAEVNKGYYRNIDIDLPLSFKQSEAWVVKKGNSELIAYLDQWLESYLKTEAYQMLCAKYYSNRRAYISPTNMFTNLQGGILSSYDKLIKEKSEEHDVDWRLVAAIIYNESAFDPEAVSWVGAQGLMQIMPDAAKTFRVDNFTTPEGNIEAGLRVLTWLDEAFMDEVPDSEERIKFVLASYNVGLGHVRDAQRLAEKHGKISIVWDDNVDYFLRNKSKAQYVNDPEVKYGSCRGEEPYRYVYKVLETYKHYCNLLPLKD